MPDVGVTLPVTVIPIFVVSNFLLLSNANSHLSLSWNLARHSAPVRSSITTALSERKPPVPPSWIKSYTFIPVALVSIFLALS